MSAVCIFSGGLDSTTLLYDMKEGWDEVYAISFDYGQKHALRELMYAYRTTRKLGLRHEIVDLTSVTHLLQSALTDHTAEIPEGHYAEDNMKATVVPNRNMIMASIAGGWAVSLGASTIGTAVHAGDHAVYPDCRPEFWSRFERTLNLGNEGFMSHGEITVYTPFIDLSKTDIADRAAELGVPYHETWSCYKGGEKHCGKCGTCVERIEAIRDSEHADLDKTEYAA